LKRNDIARGEKFPVTGAKGNDRIVSREEWEEGKKGGGAFNKKNSHGNRRGDVGSREALKKVAGQASLGTLLKRGESAEGGTPKGKKNLTARTERKEKGKGMQKKFGAMRESQ